MKKIDLSKQTLRVLTDTESAAVAGAGFTRSPACPILTNQQQQGCVPTQNFRCETMQTCTLRNCEISRIP